MEIIKPQASDLIEIVYLQKVCFSELKSRGWLACELYKEFSRDDLNNIFILKLNQLTLLGLIKLNLSAKGHSGSGNVKSLSSNPLIIDSLIIHPNWWNKNPGNLLIKFAEDYARQNGFTSVKLSTFSENQFAIMLFQQLKFQQTGEFLSKLQQIPFYSFEKIL